MNALDWALALSSDDDLEEFLETYPELYCEKQHLDKLKERKNVNQENSRIGKN